MKKLNRLTPAKRGSIIIGSALGLVALWVLGRVVAGDFVPDFGPNAVNGDPMQVIETIVQAVVVIAGCAMMVRIQYVENRKEQRQAALVEADAE